MLGLGIFYEESLKSTFTLGIALYFMSKNADYEIILFEITVFIRIYDQNVFITEICIERT